MCAIIICSVFNSSILIKPPYYINITMQSAHNKNTLILHFNFRKSAFMRVRNFLQEQTRKNFFEFRDSF